MGPLGPAFNIQLVRELLNRVLLAVVALTVQLVRAVLVAWPLGWLLREGGAAQNLSDSLALLWRHAHHAIRGGCYQLDLNRLIRCVACSMFVAHRLPFRSTHV